MPRFRFILILLGVAGTAILFQNCGKLILASRFQASLSPYSQASVDQALKDEALDVEWSRVYQSFAEYTQRQVTPSYLYPLYDVQLSTAPFLQYAVERDNVQWLRGLRALFMLGAQHLRTVNAYLFYYPVDFTGEVYVSPYQGEKPLDRPFKLWAATATPGSRFTVGGENILTSAQYLYPISVLIWDAARKGQLDDPDVVAFVATYWDVTVKDHLLRWIFNEGTRNIPNASKTTGGVVNGPGYGAFELTAWDCNAGDFSHAERVEHLTARHFGTSYFAPLYGPQSAGPGYCNSVWDTDLWILGVTAHALAAHKLNPTKLPMSSADFDRLSRHLANGLALVTSRTVYTSITDFADRAVEGAVFDPGGFNGHPDYDYTADTDPSFPGYTVAGGPVARPPKPKPGAGWDISHARRLVPFLWTMRTLQAQLHLKFQADRILRGTARQIAYVLFNRNDAQPAFTNFMDGTDGWFRVNYGGRVDLPSGGFEPSSWWLGRSILTGGYGFWQDDVPDLVPVLMSAARRESFTLDWAKIEIYPAMPPAYFR